MRVLPISLLLLACGILRAEPPLPRYPNKGNLLVWKDDAGKSHTVKTAEDWAKRRAHILEGMQEIMGRLPSDKAKVPLEVQYTEEVKAAKYTRKKLTFASEKGDRVPAWLLIPHGLMGKAPAILCLHQTVGIGKDEPVGLGKSEELRYAHHLAERGYITLAPDYPSFGEYKFDFSKSKFPSGSMKAIWNNICAVDLLVSLPEVDANRIGVIGHSLGGHNAMFTAAFDNRLKAIVSNCGFTSFPKYYGGKLKGWTSTRYMPRIAAVHNNKADRLPFDFPEVVASFAPRAFLASSPLHDDNFEVSGVKDCLAAAMPVYELLRVKEKLRANYPDCKHTFPPDVRQVAYEFLDRWLKEEAKANGKLELTLRETAGLRRFGYPVHVDLPTGPTGTTKCGFRLLESGKPIAAQFRPHRGTGQSTALDFNLNIGPLEKKTYTVEYGPDVDNGPEPKRGLEVEETDQAITVRSGGMSYVVRRDLKGLLDEVRGGKTRYLKSGSVGLLVNDKPVLGGDSEKAQVYSSGPLAVVLRLTRVNAADKSQPRLVVELTFPRSKSWVEVDVRGAGGIRSIAAGVNLEVEGKPTLVDFGAGSMVYTTLGATEAASLTGRPNGKPAWEVRVGKLPALAPFALPADARPAEGWAHLMDTRRCTALAVENFARQTEDQILAEASGQLTWSRRFSSERPPSLRFWLHFVPMPVQVGAVTSPQSMMAPLAVEVTPAK